jgi:hypothetical protein
LTCSYYGEKYTVNTLNAIDCVAPSCSEEEFMALSKAGAAELGDFYGMDCTIRPFSGLETPSPSTAGTETWVIVLLAAACCTTLLLN